MALQNKKFKPLLRSLSIMFKRVIIVGGGMSIRKAEAEGLWEKIKGKGDIWSLNYAFKAMPYLPDGQLWVDQSFFSNNQNDMDKLNKQGVTMMCKDAGVKYQFLKHDIELYEASRDEKRQSLEKKQVFTGQSGFCGMFALSLATLKEYDEIYLLGYDFGTSGLKDTDTHFYQQDKRFDYVSHGVGNPKVYYQANGSIKTAVRDFEIFSDYNQIFNVGIDSNISAFPKITYGAFFAMLEDKDVYKEDTSNGSKSSS